MTLCSSTFRAGNEDTNTLAPTDDSCVVDGCATCDVGGCVTCPDGFYAFLSIGTAVFSFCNDCQPLNCAPGSCSNFVGASPDRTSCA